MGLVNDVYLDYKKYANVDKVNILKMSIRLFLNANFRAVFLFRLSNYFERKNIFILAYIFEKLMHITTITWIARTANIKGGFVIKHIGGIVIGGNCVIGKNCEIRQGVTLGGNLGKKRYGTTQPILGNNILIGAGAKILGPVKIGDNCIIGANAVVVSDIPSNSIAAGIPAKVLRDLKHGENPLI